MDQKQLRSNLFNLLSSFVNDSNKGFCIFIGAGCSFSSGGKDFNNLKKEVVEKYTTNQINSLDLDSLFNSLFTKIDTPSERASLLKRELFINPSIAPSPSEGHEYLVALSENNIISHIVTTNFDELIEKAYENLNVTTKLNCVGPDRINAGGLLDRSDRQLLVKLHGDLNIGIYNITESELQASEYHEQLVQLIIEIIFDSQGIIFCGYSGLEKTFASLLDKIISNYPWKFTENGKSKKPFFWLSPSLPEENTPLMKVIKPYTNFSGIEEYVQELEFDEGIKSLFRAVPLDRIKFPFVDIEKIQSLLFKQESITTYIESFKKNPYYDRGWLKNEFETKLEENKSLVITAPSGCGKSTFIGSLCNNFATKKSKYLPVIISTGNYKTNMTIKEMVIFQLTANDRNFSTVEWEILNRYLEKENLKLLIVLEGINEFHNDLDECSNVIVEAKEISFWLIENNFNNIRVVVTIRTDSLKFMQALDAKKANVHKDYFNLVELDYFTDEEIGLVYDLYREQYKLQTNYEEISVEVRRYIKDPKLLEIISETYARKSVPLSLSMNKLLENFLLTKAKARNHHIYSYLPYIAHQSLENNRYSKGFQQFELSEYANLIPDLVAADILQIKSLSSNKTFFWSHDKIFEFCLSIYYVNYFGKHGVSGQSKLTIDNLSECIIQGKEFTCIYNAAKFIINDKYSGNLLFCIEFFKKYQCHMAFIKESIFDIAIYDTSTFRKLFIELLKHEDITQEIISSVIQASYYDIENLDLLWFAYLTFCKKRNFKLALEALYFFVDLIARELKSSEPTQIRKILRLMKYVKKTRAQRIGILLYLVTMIDLSNNEHLEISRLLLILCFKNFMAMPTYEYGTLDWFFSKIGRKFLFNTTKEQVHEFWNRPEARKDDLDKLVTQIPALENDLTQHEQELLFKFCDLGYNKLEKVVIQPILVALGLKNFELYKRNLRALLANSITPKQADFCTGNLAYLSLISDNYEKDFSYELNRFCVKEKADFFLDHKFYNTHEKYERLFNPIGTYGFTCSKDSSYIDLYYDLLKEFLVDQKVNEERILRTLHAVRQSVVLYPKLGLGTLNITFHKETTLTSKIKDRLVKILAEGYALHPWDVKLFLDSNHQLFSDQEIKKITFDAAPNIDAHSITILEWSRVYKAILATNTGIKYLLALCKCFNEAQGSVNFLASLRFIFESLDSLHKPR